MHNNICQILNAINMILHKIFSIIRDIISQSGNWWESGVREGGQHYC